MRGEDDLHTQHYRNSISHDVEYKDSHAIKCHFMNDTMRCSDAPYRRRWCVMSISCQRKKPLTSPPLFTLLTRDDKPRASRCYVDTSASPPRPPWFRRAEKDEILWFLFLDTHFPILCFYRAGALKQSRDSAFLSRLYFEPRLQAERWHCAVVFFLGRIGI